MQAIPATAKDWNNHSDYPLGIWQFADAMASGTGFPGSPTMSVAQSAEIVCDLP
jgi:hypothetical protein